LAFATLILILEELSWGQRFLHFTSLPGIDGREIEADFHNQIGERIDILTITNWPLAFPPLIYGVFLPLLTRIRKMASLFEQFGLVLPQLSLAPGFVLGVIFIVADIGFYEEIGECVIYMSFMFALIDPWYGQAQNHATAPSMYSRLLPTKIFAGLIALSILLWVGINAIWSPVTSTGLIYVHLDYADTYYDYALYDEAIEQYQIVIGIRPDLTYPRHKLIQSLLRNNNLTEAAQEAQKARKLAPLSTRLTNELKSHGIILETDALSKMTPPQTPIDP
jgi:tetratricopeptide (TPR) repeat protein